MAKNRIDAVLEACRESNRKALIAYLTAGDGGLETTQVLVKSMNNGGADLVVLGVPFSDPIAEAPVVQQASERALAAGVTLSGIFEMMKTLESQVPVLMMMYLNTIFCYGKERFFGLCKSCGVCGVIVPDMPYEEKDEITAQAAEYGISLISTITSYSTGRMKMIADEAEGFLYCVSSGKDEAPGYLIQAESVSSLPVIAEVSSADMNVIPQLLPYCEGILLSDALASLLAENPENPIESVQNLIASVRASMNA